ncbi:MAG: hypothetical protein ACYTEX_17000 [Planctomycetota bacterium]|jgi:hypothetical protein
MSLTTINMDHGASDCVVVVGQVLESVAAIGAHCNKDGLANSADLGMLKPYSCKSAVAGE